MLKNKKPQIKNFLFFFVFTLFFLSCNINKKSNVVIEYYPSGSIKKIYVLNGKENDGKEILYYENGNIKSLTNYVNNLKESEQLNFHESGGLLKSKLLFNKNIANGVAYWFYESGSLKASRNYDNDKQWHVGFDYWDGMFVVNKAVVRFDANGSVYYKMNFDTTGKFLNAEGKEK